MSTDRGAGEGAGGGRPGVWGAAALLAGVHATAFGDRFLTALIAAPLTHDLGLSDAQFGLIQGACFVALYLVATPLFGRLADRIAPRRVILAGLCIWTAATFALAFCHSFAEVAATRLLLGAGEAALTPAALALIAARAGSRRSGRALSVFTSGSTLGKGLALFLGGALLAVLTHRLAGQNLGQSPGEAPWRVLLQLSIIPNLLLAAALLVSRDEISAPPNSAPKVRPRLDAVAAHIRTRAGDYLRLTLGSGAVVVLSQTLATWIPLFYVRSFGLAPATAGMLTGAELILCASAGSLLAGAALDHFGRRGPPDLPLRVIGTALLLTALGALATLTAPSLAISATGYAVILLCLGAAAPAALVQLKTLSPTGMRGSVSAIYLAVVTLIGFGVGPPAVGFMSDRLFGPGHHLSEALLTFVAVACTIGLAGVALPCRSRAFGTEAPSPTP
jgi:MFS family permease